ncbi:MAG: DUF6159 family protein [Methanocalculus sp.]|uniref:DUF6159 family protein n=1 Tax=Methanocalculus sp. TaxID=2004547 RepID=UPI0027232781|nr:DUF6159 family protein [Methanocalculus sp.]MDO9539783.1 DUF6159 family protein [Methanocalculus sp.]
MKRGWRLFTETFAILSKEKSLILYPIISGIVILLILGLLFIPVLFLFLVSGINPDDMGLAGYAVSVLILFVIFLVTACISSFFKAGIVFNATEVIKGRNPVFMDGIHVAVTKTGSIFTWAVITATVGLILSMLSESDNPLGRMITQILVGIAGAAWNLATFFVIPVMIFEDAGAVSAIKESWVLFRKTWSETVVAGFSFAVVFIPAFLLFAASFFMVIVGPFEVFLLMIALSVILFALSAVIVSALQGILVALLYHYAKTGEISSLVDKEFIEGAFVEKSGVAGSVRFTGGNI